MTSLLLRNALLVATMDASRREIADGAVYIEDDRIVAVFVPVAFMGGGAGEWFRPFAVTVVSSVLVSLFISFTLDPMLSAYWGDPPGHSTSERRGLEKWFARFNIWFDHQANRYGAVIEWALHHRTWMAVGAFTLLFGSLFYQAKFGRMEFLPKSDSRRKSVEAVAKSLP